MQVCQSGEQCGVGSASAHSHAAGDGEATMSITLGRRASQLAPTTSCCMASDYCARPALRIHRQ